MLSPSLLPGGVDPELHGKVPADVDAYVRVLQRVYWPGLKAFLPEQRSQYGRRGVDPLADEMLEDVRKMPEAVRMPVDMPCRRPGGPHRFGDPGNAVWDRLPGKGYYFGMSRPYVYQLIREGPVSRR